jgi:hypothetical protein
MLEAIEPHYRDTAFKRRFNMYSKVILPTEEVFYARSYLVFWTCMHVWVAHPTQPNNVNIDRVHSTISDMIQVIPGIGPLIGMHAVVMLEESGLLPSWLQTYATFAHSGRIYKKCVSRFGLGKTKVGAKRAIASLKFGLSLKIGITMVEVVVENLGCKAIQFETRPNSPVWDVHHLDAPIVRRNADGNGLMVWTVDGCDIDLEAGNLMNRWPFGSDNLSIPEIANRLGVPSTLPSAMEFFVRRPSQCHWWRQRVAYVGFSFAISDPLLVSVEYICDKPMSNLQIYIYVSVTHSVKGRIEKVMVMV